MKIRLSDLRSIDMVLLVTCSPDNVIAWLHRGQVTCCYCGESSLSAWLPWRLLSTMFCTPCYLASFVLWHQVCCLTSICVTL